jgi:hypothetical protein
VHQQQDPLLSANAEGGERCGEAAGTLLELAVGDAAAVVDVGDARCAAAVDVEQVMREVERFGRRQHRWEVKAGEGAR